MRDPRRLDEGEATTFERQLLDAAKRDVPGSALKAQMQEALGLLNPTSPVHVPGKAAAGGKATATGQSAAAAGKSVLGGWTGTIGLALVAVGLAVSVPVVLRAGRHSQVTPPPQTSPALETPTTAPAPVTLTPPPSEAHPPSSVNAALPTKDADLAAAGVEPGAGDGTRESAGSLREEIRLLDRARTAMVAGAPRRALAELEQYRAHYPRGAFSPEATVLLIEALKDAGEIQRAKALGRQFLAQHPKSPLSERVALLVRRP